MLGRDGSDIVSSGDDVADAATRQQFLAAYDAKHQVTMEGDNKATMVIGQDDFPFPIPLVRKDGMWRFDTTAGRLEILYRRIGRNELDTIQTCLAYVDAQNEYAEKDRTGAGVGVYAQRVVSRPARRTGSTGRPRRATTRARSANSSLRRPAKATVSAARAHPFHGYYYKILTRQGPTAPGGALDYVVQGKMIGGFALVAYPAEYGNSGVMTFIVNHAGVVYQKDLGPRTARLASRMTSFNPDQTWKKVAVTALPQ